MRLQQQESPAKITRLLNGGDVRAHTGAYPLGKPPFMTQKPQIWLSLRNQGPQGR